MYLRVPSMGGSESVRQREELGVANLFGEGGIAGIRVRVATEVVSVRVMGTFKCSRSQLELVLDRVQCL